MKKITYTMKLLSSLIVSPRSGQALYKDIDEFLVSPVEIYDNKSNEKHEVKVVYPFYQYGQYEKYDPKHTDYYLPGSSIKGALLHQTMQGNHLMADDVPVSNSRIVLRNLCKAQFLEKEEDAKFAPFFEHVGVEMIKGETELEGNLYLEENIEFSGILEQTAKDTKDKMNQMCEYLEILLMRDYKNKDLKKDLKEIKDKLSLLSKESDVILLGGYKGLLHSILLDNNNMNELTGGVFIDPETSLPHGIVKVKLAVNG